MDIAVEGTCDRNFGEVKEAFVDNFEMTNEIGAAVAIYVDGKLVVDLWGGHSDKARTKPWTRDTLVNVYSTTKGLAAMCAHRLVDQGKLDLEAPVAKYWPEFAQAGKDKLPVKYLLSHRAGLPAIRKTLPPEALYDWKTMTDALAAQEPWWTPGTKHGYHAITYGWLVGEVVRRASGKTLGTYFRDEIVSPLGLDAHIGLDAKEDSRVSNIIPSAPPKAGEVNQLAAIMSDPESITFKAIMNPGAVLAPEVVNGRAWRGMELPSANGHATARSLAKAYGALARGGEIDGYRVLTPASIERCYTEQSFGMDEVLKQSTRVGLGFMLSQPGVEMGPNPHTFGHPGAGGSIGFADPTAKVGFGYVMNQMGVDPLLDPRAARLFTALYKSL
ncbi:MAG TPA: serine hydrolase domain-containing protein [Candidatus Binataceae bacterium]|nr:serine hydrolase domain-containing protein [Candidatus Binataceae bacterium]